MIKDSRLRKKVKIRKKISGDEKIPRLSIFRSLHSIYVQAIDDVNSRTLCSAMVRGKKNQTAANQLANDLASKLKQKNVVKAKFDRNGYKFGVVLKAFVEGLRQNSINI